jgi:hypothetical protein
MSVLHRYAKWDTCLQVRTPPQSKSATESSHHADPLHRPQVKQCESEKMGNRQCKPPPQKHQSKLDEFRSKVEDELARRMMLQREIQMAVNIAKARDTLCIFGTAWGTLVSGVAMARLAGKHVPPVAGVPIVIGGLVLGNVLQIWRMATNWHA